MTAVFAEMPGRSVDAGRPVLSLNLRGKGFGDTQVLGPIELALYRGETVAITGPSGAGKSTLLRIMAGLDESFDGRVSRPGRIALVFQEPTLLPWRSALANICLATGASAERARRFLADTGLAAHQGKRPDQMSLGQQRRLALARALAHEPDVLLLDEPFVSLDPELAEEITALFETLRAQSDWSAVLVTHEPREAARLAGRIYRLSGSPATLGALR